MKPIHIIIANLVICLCYSADEYYYDIVSRELTNGGNQIYTVASDLSVDQITKAVEEDRMIKFNKSYVYNVSNDSMINIVEWDKGLSGVIITRGRDIISIRPRTIEPTKLVRIRQPAIDKEK